MNVDFVRGCFPSDSFDIKNNPWSINPRTGIWGKFENGQEVLYGIERTNEKKVCEYTGIIESNDFLFFIPGWQDTAAPYIKKYNIQSKTSEIISFDEIVLPKLHTDKLFSDGCAIGKYVFMFGLSFPIIVRINTKTNETDYVRLKEEDFDGVERHNDQNSFFDVHQFVVDGEQMYLACTKISAVLKVNIETLEYELTHIDCDADYFFNLTDLDDDRLLIGCGGNTNNVFVWNRKSGVIEKTIVLKNPKKRYPLTKILKVKNDFFYLFPCDNWEPDKLDIYTLNTENDELNNTGLLENINKLDDSEVIWGQEVLYACLKDEHKILFVTGKDLLWHEYDLLNGTINEYEVGAVKNGDYERIIEMYYKSRITRREPLREQEVSVAEFCNNFIV